MKLKEIKIGMFEVGESSSRRDVCVLDCGNGINPGVEEQVRESWWYDAITAYDIGGRVIAFFILDRGFWIKEDGSLKKMGESAVTFCGTVDEFVRHMVDENLIADYEDNHPRVIGEEEVEI